MGYKKELSWSALCGQSISQKWITRTSRVMTVVILTASLSACGLKGELKRPSEIQQEQEKPR